MSPFRNGVYESHGYDSWQTPQHVLDELTKEFGEMYDPCPNDWDGTFNGLEIDWHDDKVNFVNPPYREIKAWAEKCHNEWVKGRTVVLLIPSRTDTAYFHDWIYNKAELRFIRGRLKFVDARNPDAKTQSAPFPSMLCIYRGWTSRYLIEEVEEELS